jgi:predicted transcriptional regulator
MVATVRLDDALESKLNNLASTLHKKKSDVIREAIEYYAKSIEKNKKSRILKAVEKTKNADKAAYEDFEGTLSDGL